MEDVFGQRVRVCTQNKLGSVLGIITKKTPDGQVLVLYQEEGMNVFSILPLVSSSKETTSEMFCIPEDHDPLPSEELIKQLGMSEYQKRAFLTVLDERKYQDKIWGPVSIRPHEVGAWLTLMRVYLTRAEFTWSTSNNDTEALNHLRKCVAIGMACGEQHGFPLRSSV